MKADYVYPGFHETPYILYGSVLIGGLGIGWMTRKVMESTNVTRIVVVEIDADVIGWFNHADPRLEIVQGDFVDYVKDHHAEFNFITADGAGTKSGWLKTDRWQIPMADNDKNLGNYERQVLKDGNTVRQRPRS